MHLPLYAGHHGLTRAGFWAMPGALRSLPGALSLQHNNVSVTGRKTSTFRYKLHFSLGFCTSSL